MAGFGIKTPWTRQPQYPVGIDNGNPITKGLWVAYTAPVLGAQSATGGKPLVSIADSSKYSVSGSIQGKSLLGNGASSTAAKGTIGTVGDLPFYASPQFSCFAVVQFADLSSATECAIFRAAGTGAGTGIALDFFPNTKSIRPLIATNGVTGWSASYDEVDSNIVVGIPWGIGVTYVSGRRITYSGPIGCIPREFTRTAITGTISSDTGANKTPYYGGMEYATNATIAFPGHINAFFAAGREFTRLEMLSLFANPWQIFQPLERRIWVPSAGGGTTISTGLGALTITGQTPTVTVTGQNTNIATSAGSLSIAGLAPTVSRTEHLFASPGLGALTITGYAPTVSIGVSGIIINPDVGALTVTGLVPAVARTEHQYITPDVGALTVTGFAPVLVTTGPVTVTPDVGQLSITGFAPEVINTSATTQPQGGGIGHAAKKRKYKTKKQQVWLVEVDDKEYEVEDLEEIAPIVAKKLAKGKTPSVKAKPLVDDKREAGQIYTQQPWLTEYVPIPAYEKRLNFVDILPYIIAMQEMEEEEELLLMAA